MRTFENKPESTHQAMPVRSTILGRKHLGKRSDENSIRHLQRTIGNQAVQQLLRERMGRVKEDSTNTRLPRFGHDFSSIPVHRGMDARGGRGDGELEDQRPPALGGGSSTARPTPINVRNGPRHAVIDSGDRVGMSIAITISSSSGSDADMAGIQDSEQVGLSYNHAGCMSGVPPLPSSQSGFMAGYPIPDDQHAWSKRSIINLADNHGGSGSFEKQQLDIYKDPAAGVTAPRVIPASGYIIKRIITKSGTAISFRTEKRATAASVNGYTTTAGPSPTYSKDVVIRSSLSRGAKTAIGIGGGAAVGAGAGALIGGPVGAGIGAVLGGIAGGIGSLFF